MKQQHCPFTIAELLQGGEVSSTAAAQGALHMKGAPSAASTLCPVLTAELVPPAFFLQGPGSHNMSLSSAVSPGSSGSVSLPVKSVPGPSQLLWTPHLLSHRDSQKLWAQTHGQGRGEAVDAQIRAVIHEQDQPERER